MECRKKSYTPLVCTVQINFWPVFIISKFLSLNQNPDLNQDLLVLKLTVEKKNYFILLKNFFVGLYEETMLQEKHTALP